MTPNRSWHILGSLKRGSNKVGQKGRKVKSLGLTKGDTEIFWMSLEEAKAAIAGKYEFLVDQYEQRSPKENGVKKVS
ncbi:MAG TPA: hypothetical protein VLF41_00600 [Candidatus Nanoarchaeia archaeon]|nr:hypothetical protein [Candidatus Nanoarchaeia archaeon]